MKKFLPRPEEAAPGVGTSPLHLALYNSNIERIEFFARDPYNIGAPDQQGRTPLCRAIFDENIDRIKLLIRWEADVNFYYQLDYIPLRIAVKIGNLEILKLLINKGANINILDEHGRNALSLLMIDNTPDRNIKIEIAALLIEHGADVNSIDRYNLSPLCYALKKDNMQGAALLIRNGADVNNTDQYGCSLLHHALDTSNEWADLFIMSGADTSKMNGFGESILFKAIDKKYTDILKLLIEKGVNISSRDRNLDLMLDYAMKKNNVELAELLIKGGANVDAINRRHYSLLHRATRDEDLAMMKLLYERGVDIDAEDRHHRSPLKLAEQRGKIKAAQFLKIAKLVKHLLDEQILQTVGKDIVIVILELVNIEDDVKNIFTQRLLNDATKKFDRTGKVSDLQENLNFVAENIKLLKPLIALESINCIVNNLDIIAPLLKNIIATDEDLEALKPLLENVDCIVRNSQPITYILSDSAIYNSQQAIEEYLANDVTITNLDLQIISPILGRIADIARSLENIKPSLEKILEEALGTSFLTKGVTSLSTSDDSSFISLSNMCILKQPEAIRDSINRLPSDIREKIAKLCELFPNNAKFVDLLRVTKQCISAENHHSSGQVDEGNDTAFDDAGSANNTEIPPIELAGNDNPIEPIDYTS